ncbi:Phytochrome-like protein cph2 [Pigmentiphaga humi]|uniref:Phytochrome-like protein cph2 n=1 Tax=Pigmentiphaga humi TaxID=2478468 RepID=A0A3P4B3W4_9BURK|nr:bifunctional diguanylate cyclase/phosphodiesterase [Pigmentiphaga humi]VCU70216.1 Phytochrome-like protein cph2 [Pigmentiphaga humi]
MDTLLPFFLSALTPVALTAGYVALRAWLPGRDNGRYHLAILFGAAMWLTLVSSVRPGDGTLVDMRGTILTLAVLFGGWLPAAVALAVGVAARLWMGGATALIGVAVMVSTYLGVYAIVRLLPGLFPAGRPASFGALALAGAWTALNQFLALWSAGLQAHLLLTMPASQFCVTLIAGGLLIVIEQRTNLGQKLGEQQDLMRTMLIRDSATGLLNRTGFWLELGAALRALPGETTHQLAILTISLRRMRRVRAALGPSDTDALLLDAARRLNQSLGVASLARLDDITFCLYTPVEHLHETSGLAETIFQAFRKPFTLHGGEVHLGLNIGVSAAPADGDSVEALIAHSNQALARSVALGENKMQVYSHDIAVPAIRQFKLEVGLARALETGAELWLAYQPKVCLQTGRLHSVEALCRWSSPDLGNIGPDEFIAAAESSDLIIPLGLWVLEETCRQLAGWKAQGLHVPAVAVNLSSKQLLDPDFPDKARLCAARHGLPTSLLEFELTETAIMSNPDSALAMLHGIKQAGFKLALDDFGTGYSNIRYLKNLPVDYLKIDKTFIEGLGRDSDSADLCRAIFLLGNALDLDMLVEGVETEAQRVELCRMGFRLGQGYLFSHPVSAAQFAQRWLGEDAPMPLERQTAPLTPEPTPRS